MYPPSIRKRCLAGTDSAGIHSLLTLLVGAEGKHTARVWLYESTARLAEAARLNSDDPHSGTIQSNKQKDSLLAEFMGHKPIVKPDSGAFLHRKAVERKCLIGIETGAELIRSYKTALKTHGRLRGSTQRAEGWLSEDTAASLAETRQLNWDDSRSVTIQLNKQKPSSLSEITGHKPIIKSDTGVYPKRKERLNRQIDEGRADRQK